MKSLLLLSTIFLIFSCKPKTTKTTEETLQYAWDSDSCKYGDYSYLNANYIDIKKEYSKALLEIKKSHTHCFCDTPPTNLPGLNIKDSGNPKNETNYIAPVYLNVNSCDGVYSARTTTKYNRSSVMTYNRGNPHYLFLISNGIYYALKENKRIFNSEIFSQEKRNLLKSFSEDEIQNMVSFSINGLIWGNHLHYPPMLIKKDDKVIFDMDAEID